MKSGQSFGVSHAITPLLECHATTPTPSELWQAIVHKHPNTLNNMGKKDRKKKLQAAKSVARQGRE